MYIVNYNKLQWKSKITRKTENIIPKKRKKTEARANEEKMKAVMYIERAEAIKERKASATSRYPHKC